MTSRLVLRRAQREDIARVLVNETCAYPVPWGKQALIDSLDPQYDFFVAELDEQIVGHLIVQVILDESHLLNLCLHPRYQGRGLGKQMMQYWLDSSRSQTIHQLLLEVRESNTKALKLYESMGFQKLSVRKNYYPLPDNQREHGVVMSQSFPEQPVGGCSLSQ
ncbi:ribosomal protein S18-alanine N-acetyltransferase [Pleionea sediminis]|uniref:ribosomal protein S18-alanine N-acetyltransferase n=1 Tax=Pleionea sediminis TaxID=2569479 RepID=UPI001184DBFE|nr:ribosomal protein S18-alanine N-acetyltransferase [Pleionea sediminis]